MSTENNNERSFLGRGWGFPPQFNKRKRTVEMLEAEADIESSLRILMATGLGERTLRSKYGSRIATMLFNPIDASQRALLRSHINDIILLHEPRIRPLRVEVSVDSLEGRVEIDIDYKVMATNTRRNFVYPFYQIEGTEVQK